MGPWPWPFLGNLAVLLALSCTVAAIVTWVAVRKFNVALEPTGIRRLYPLTASAMLVVLLAVVVPTGVELIPMYIPNAPACGAGCHRVEWSKGLAGWGAGREWHVAQGLLINDGSNHSNQGSCSAAPTLVLPYQPTTPDYAIEVQAQFPHLGGQFPHFTSQFPFFASLDYRPPNTCFGIYARVGTADRCWVEWVDGGFLMGSAGGASYVVPGGFPAEGPGSDWHIYRFDVKGPNLTLYIDGFVEGAAQDTTLPTAPGRIGLADYVDVLYIRSIVVRTL